MKKLNFLFIIILIFLFFNTAFSQENPDMEISPVGNTGSSDVPLPTSGESVSADNSIIQINPLDEKGKLYSFELRDAEIGDVFRILAHDYKLNLLVDKDVQGKVTATLSSVTLDEALEAIAESQNLVLEKKNNIVKVSPNLVTKTFTLKYIEAKSIVESAESSSTTGSTSGSGTAADTTAQASAPAAGAEATPSESASSSAKKANTVYDLLSDKGIILLGKQPNSVMVIDYPPNLKKVDEYFKAIDRKMASRFFKLKYLKAADVVGQSSSSSTSEASSAAPTTGASEGSSTNTSSSSSSSGSSH